MPLNYTRYFFREKVHFLFFFDIFTQRLKKNRESGNPHLQQGYQERYFRYSDDSCCFC